MFVGIRPDRRVDLLAFLVSSDPASQVLLHSIFGKIISLEVQKDVIWSWLGQQRKAMVFVKGFLDLVFGLALFFAKQLNTSLVSDLRQRFYSPSDENGTAAAECESVRAVSIDAR